MKKTIYHCDKCDQAVYRGNLYQLYSSAESKSTDVPEYCRNCIADVMTAKRSYVIDVFQVEVP